MKNRRQVVVVGAGIVGAACAYFLSQDSVDVIVVDAGPIVGGTSGSGEGNILVSDKEPGPELELSMHSLDLWREFGSLPGIAEAIELEPKGGLVVSESELSLSHLKTFSDGQHLQGVSLEMVASDDLPGYEPYLSRDLAGGCYYPQDMQVQPMLAAATLLSLAGQRGAAIRSREPVVGMMRDGSRVVGVRTVREEISADFVVNATGVRAAAVAELAGVEITVEPRRGFVLVTEALPPIIRHKVYLSSLLRQMANDAPTLEVSAVVEGTPSGPILIGQSRERVGFDPTFSLPIVRRQAACAVELFPFLKDVAMLRIYRGFRPYCPDHLPVIGHDPRAPGLIHACGHEGSGIGQSMATGSLIQQLIADVETSVDLSPFCPDRFPLKKVESA